MHESLVQSLGKNEMSVPWRANWSRVHGPSSENRGVSWAISWFLMEIGLRPRCSSTGKAHRVKKAHHFWHDRNRCCWKIGNCFFFFCNYFKCILHWTNDLRSFCVHAKIENIILLKWCRCTYCVYANDIIWSFGVWIENFANTSSGFF